MRDSPLSLRSLWLLAPPILMSCLDNGLTLNGQSSRYWEGNYAAVNEWSPSFHYFLSIHPLAFAGMTLVWMAIFSTLIAILPEKAGMTVSITVVLGHMIGAGSWPPFRGSYQLGSALILSTSIVIVTSFSLGRCGTGQPILDWSCTGLPSWTRWAIAVGLFCLPVWWFLIPH